MLISLAVTAKLICAFVFAYADCWFSHALAHIVISGFALSLEPCEAIFSHFEAFALSYFRIIFVYFILKEKVL